MFMILTVVIGVLAGLMAGDFKPGTAPGGFWMRGPIGVAGAVLGYLGGQWAGWYGAEQPLGFVAAVIGASLLLAIFNTVRRVRAN